MSRCLALIALAAITLPIAAQQKRPITFADLQAIKRISDPQISPSGKWVLFSVTDVSLEKNTKTNHLWAVPLAGGKRSQLTNGSGESNGRFSPDGKWVLYSNADDSQLWLAPWDDATGKTPRRQARHQRSKPGPTAASGRPTPPHPLHLRRLPRMPEPCRHRPRTQRRRSRLQRPQRTPTPPRTR